MMFLAIRYVINNTVTPRTGRSRLMNNSPGGSATHSAHYPPGLVCPAAQNSSTAGEDSPSITVTVTAAGSDQKTVSFDVDVVSDQVSKMATVQVDRSEMWQTIEGMGTFENEKRWIDLYAVDMGASAVRVGLIGNQIEPVNDNNDPFILDMKALNYGAFDFEYFRMPKEAGVETFILPPGARRPG
jgi:hypothetical protein